MLLRTLPTTLLEIFCEIIVVFKVIVQSMKDPDDNFDSNLSMNGLTLMQLVTNLTAEKITETLAFGYSSESTQ